MSRSDDPEKIVLRLSSCENSFVARILCTVCFGEQLQKRRSQTRKNILCSSPFQDVFKTGNS